MDRRRARRLGRTEAILCVAAFRCAATGTGAAAPLQSNSRPCELRWLQLCSRDYRYFAASDLNYECRCRARCRFERARRRSKRRRLNIRGVVQRRTVTHGKHSFDLQRAKNAPCAAALRAPNCRPFRDSDSRAMTRSGAASLSDARNPERLLLRLLRLNRCRTSTIFHARAAER